MGFLDKLIGGINKVDDVKTDVETELFKDRRFDRADAVLEEGGAYEAVLTGIQGCFENGSNHVRYRLEWSDPEPRAAAITYLATDAAASLRLGSTVPVRTLEDHAVVDTRLTQALAGGATGPGLTTRAIPEPGVDDTSLSSPVLSRLKKWTPERGTVVSFEPVEVLGMATQNWTIRVDRADDTRATVKRDFVPPYARWFVVPGADLPIVVDPDDGTRAQVDWPGLAAERPGGSWRDLPPQGSVAALMVAPPAAPPERAMAVASAPLDLTPSAEASEAIEGVSIETCARIDAGLQKDRVSPDAYDTYATDGFGVPAGRYIAIKAQWDARTRSDWRVGAAYGEAFEAERKALKKRR